MVGVAGPTSKMGTARSMVTPATTTGRVVVGIACVVGAAVEVGAAVVEMMTGAGVVVATTVVEAIVVATAVVAATTGGSARMGLTMGPTANAGGATGGSTVTLNAAVPTWPNESTAVQLTPVNPTGNNVPAAGRQLTVPTLVVGAG